MKKMIALVLTLLFLIPSFALADEVPTLTLWGPGANPQYDWDDTVLVKKLEEKFGINLECTSVGWDEYKTKLTLMLAEDNLPDIILGAFSLAEAIQYGDQGYLLKFNDYIDTYAPTLAATMKAYPDFKNYMGSSEERAVFSGGMGQPSMVSASGKGNSTPGRQHQIRVQKRERNQGRGQMSPGLFHAASHSEMLRFRVHPFLQPRPFSFQSASEIVHSETTAVQISLHSETLPKMKKPEKPRK